MIQQYTSKGHTGISTVIRGKIAKWKDRFWGLQQISINMIVKRFVYIAFVYHAEKEPSRVTARFCRFSFTVSVTFSEWISDDRYFSVITTQTDNSGHSKCKSRVMFKQLGYNPCVFHRHFKMLMCMNAHIFRRSSPSKPEPHRNSSKPPGFLRILP